MQSNDRDATWFPPSLSLESGVVPPSLSFASTLKSDVGDSCTTSVSISSTRKRWRANALSPPPGSVIDMNVPDVSNEDGLKCCCNSRIH